jgi:WD40 repeat protein
VIHQLVGHREAVSCVAVSSDGILLITGSLDASVKLWDIRSGIELANLFVGSACTCCAFDAEAAHIMAGTQDSSLHIFNTKSLQERHTLLSHRLGVRACVFSADSTKVLSAGSDAKVMLWDLARLPPGRKLVEAPHAVLEAHALGCRALVWNPRLATQAASGGEDAQIVVWDLASGAAERTLSGHDGPVLALAYTPSGAYILSSSADSSVRVWEPFCSSPLFTFHAHAGPVYAVVVTVDEYRCISAGADSTLRTWDLRGLISEDPEAERLARGPQSPGADSPARLPSADGSPAAGSPARSPAGGFWAVTPPGSPGSPGSPGGKGRARGQMQFADVTSLCFSPQGDVIVSASQDTSYALRSVEDGAIIGEPRRGHALPVTCAEFHPEGRLLLTASEDQSIKLWEVQSGRLMSTIRGNTATVAAARYFPDGRRAVSVSWDHSVRLWDMETSRETFRFPPHLAHASPARCVAVSPDNNVLATGGHDSFVRVWDVRQRQLVRKLIGHLGNVLSCAFSRDGASILSGSEDSTARLWNLNGYTVHKFEHHTAPVTCVDVTPSGRHFLTGSKDKHVAIYSALSLREVGRWVCESACGCVASSSRSGGIVACGDTTGITYVLKSVLSPCGEWRHF